MFKIKFLISIMIFSFLLVVTSIIKNQTRELEKKIISLDKLIHLKKRDLNESQLDFSYLTSPSMIELRVENLDNFQYIPMEYSKIFLDISSFIDLKNKFANQINNNDKEIKEK